MARQCFKCFIGYEMNQNTVSTSQHAVLQYMHASWDLICSDDLNEGSFLAQTFLTRQAPVISLPWYYSTGLLLQQLRLENFSLFLICSCSLCNSTTGFVCWEKRVERRQVKSSQWADCQTQSPCGFNWLYCLSLMSTSPVDPVVLGHSISCWTAVDSNDITILLRLLKAITL